MNLRNAIYPLHVIAAALKRSGLGESVLMGKSASGFFRAGLYQVASVDSGRIISEFLPIVPFVGAKLQTLTLPRLP